LRYAQNGVFGGGACPPCSRLEGRVRDEQRHGTVWPRPPPPKTIDTIIRLYHLWQFHCFRVVAGAVPSSLFNVSSPLVPTPDVHTTKRPRETMQHRCDLSSQSNAYAQLRAGFHVLASRTGFRPHTPHGNSTPLLLRYRVQSCRDMATRASIPSATQPSAQTAKSGAPSEVQDLDERRQVPAEQGRPLRT